MKTSSVDNRQDIIDSRDVVARIAELESDRESLTDDLTSAQDAIKDSTDPEEKEELNDKLEAAQASVTEWDESDDGQELRVLKSLAEQAEGYAADWKHGETLIRDSYFETYAEELANDIGAIDSKQIWPLTCIDWEQAADELKQDYTEVDFDGVSYWIRS